MTTVNTLQSGGQGTAIPSGYIGQQLISTVSASTNFTANNAWFDMTSLSIAQGVWAVSLHTAVLYNTTNTTADYANFGISVDSGITFSDIISTVNSGAISKLTGRADGFATSSGCIPAYVINVSGSTYPAGRTYYAKMNMTYTGTAPQFRCTLQAIRIG